MAFCSECGEKVQDDAKFCESCGTPTGDVPYAPHVTRRARVSNVEPSEPAVVFSINWEGLKEKFSFLRNQSSIIFVVLFIAAITNPSEYKHQRAVASLAVKEYSKTEEGMMANGLLGLLGDESGGALIDGMIAGVLNSVIKSQNCMFFSLTKVTTNGKYIGVGVFGKVYLFPGVNFEGAWDDDDEDE